jgi:hypothetical protein
MTLARNYIVLYWVKEIVSEQRITFADSNIEPRVTIPHINLGTFQLWVK